MTELESDLPLPSEGPVLTLAAQIEKLQTGDPGERYYAAWWLGRMRLTAGVPALIQALQDPEQTPTGAYPVRRNAVRALAKLGDLIALEALMDCIESSDPQLAAAAIQALGDLVQIHPQTLTQVEPILIHRLQTLTEAGLSTTCHPSLLEALLETLGSFTSPVAALIEPYLHHRSLRVNCSAARALYLITQQPHYAEKLVPILQHENIHIRRAALLDLGATGFVPAAPLIANAAVEINIKLLAFKKLLDRYLRSISAPDDTLINLFQLLETLI